MQRKETGQGFISGIVKPPALSGKTLENCRKHGWDEPAKDKTYTCKGKSAGSHHGHNDPQVSTILYHDMFKKPPSCAQREFKYTPCNLGVGSLL